MTSAERPFRVSLAAEMAERPLSLAAEMAGVTGAYSEDVRTAVDAALAQGDPLLLPSAVREAMETHITCQFSATGEFQGATCRPDLLPQGMTMLDVQHLQFRLYRRRVELGLPVEWWE